MTAYRDKYVFSYIIEKKQGYDTIAATTNRGGML
jgi:hypothetical protein